MICIRLYRGYFVRFALLLWLLTVAPSQAAERDAFTVYLQDTLGSISARLYWINCFSPSGRWSTGSLYEYELQLVQAALFKDGQFYRVLEYRDADGESYRTQVTAISNNGFAVGIATNSGGNRASRAIIWGPDGVPADIGPAWITPTTQTPSRFPFGVNSDGSMVVGVWSDGNLRRGFAWTRDGRVRVLNTLGDGLHPASDLRSAALYIDPADNSIIGSSSLYDTQTTIVQWTDAGDPVDMLPAWTGNSVRPYLPIGDNSGLVGSISDPSLSTYFRSRAMRWSSERGLEVLDRIRGLDMPDSLAIAGSTDGRVVVGDYPVLHPNGLRSFIWYQDDTPMRIEDFMSHRLRLEIVEWRLDALGVHPDGSKVYGMANRGSTSDGSIEQRAFILDITPPCDGDWDVDGRLNFFDIYGYLTDYNTEHPAADLDRDGDVETEDLFRFVDAFVGGCP